MKNLKNNTKENKKKLDKKVSRNMTIALSAILGLSTIGFIYLMKDANRLSEKKHNLYEKVITVADKNKDGFTNHNEWSKVYKDIGWKYDLNYSSPFEDLKIKDMERYLENKLLN